MRYPKLLIYIAILVTAFLGGAVSQYLIPGRPLTTIHWMSALLGAMLLFVWYRVDSDQRGYRRSRALNTGIIFLALLAVPYYFFRTRRWLRGLGATVAFLLTVLLFSVLQAFGAVAAYYLLQA